MHGLKYIDPLIKVTKDSISLKKLAEILTNWAKSIDLKKLDEAINFVNKLLIVKTNKLSVSRCFLWFDWIFLFYI